jgi:transposase
METTQTIDMHISDAQEYRRILAWRMYTMGYRQIDIATTLQVTRGAISQWLKCAREQGCAALHKRSFSGRPAYLRPEQKAQIPALLERGAQVYGFVGDVWDRMRLRQLIKQELGVTYPVSPITRLLPQIRRSRPKPVPRASQRNEEALKEWLDERWPTLKESVSKRDEPLSS